jgi:hypothetical protein
MRARLAGEVYITAHSCEIVFGGFGPPHPRPSSIRGLFTLGHRRFTEKVGFGALQLNYNLPDFEACQPTQIGT